MLVDEQDADILSLRRKVVKCLLEHRVLRLRVDDEEVLLRVGRRRDVLQLEISARVGRESGVINTPMPASNMPVTVSCIRRVISRKDLNLT